MESLTARLGPRASPNDAGRRGAPGVLAELAVIFSPRSGAARQRQKPCTARRPPGGNSDEANEADRLPAGAELFELPGIVAPSAGAGEFGGHANIMNTSAARSKPANFISPSSMTGSPFRIVSAMTSGDGAARHTRGKARSGGGRSHHGPCHRKRRDRGHLLDDLLQTVPCRARVCHGRPAAQRPGCLERRHFVEQLGGEQVRPRQASRTRSALRPRRRIHGGRARTLGHLGRRFDRVRSREWHLRRSRQGPSPRSQGKVLQLARTVHRAALAAGPSGPSSRPDRAGGARNSPRAGANCCSSSTPISQPRRNTIAS